MATRVDRSYIRGFLAHDLRQTLWSAQTTATQAGPRAGEAVPTVRSDGTIPDASLRAYGEQDAATTLTIQVQQGGHVGDAGFSWDDGSGTPRGWDNAVHPAVYEPVDWTTSARHPHAAATPDGYVHVIAYRDAGTSWTVRMWTRDPDTGEWSDVGPIYAADEDPGQTLYGTVAVDGAGNCWAWHWVVDATAGLAQVRSYVRRPGGTWSVVQQAALVRHVDTGDYALGRIRAAINAEGQVLLLAHLIPAGASPAGDVLFQYAAEHPAAPLAAVSQDLEGRGYPEVVVKDGAFWCFYLVYYEPITLNHGHVYCRVLGSAYEPMDSAEAVDVPEGFSIQEARVDGTPQFSEGELAAVVTEDNTLYLYCSDYGGAPPDTVRGAVYRYRGTLGAPRGIQANGWDFLGSGSAGTWFLNHPSADNTEYPSSYCAVAHRGRVIILANPQTTSSATRKYLSALYMGGFSSLPRPSRYLSAFDPDRDPLEYSYVPYAQPGDFGWTATGAGTETLTATGNLHVATTSAIRYFAVTTAGGPTSGASGYLRYWVQVDSGGSLSSGQVFTELIISDGTTYWTATIHHALSGGTQQLRVYDTLGDQIGDDVDTGVDDKIEVLVGLVKTGTTAAFTLVWRVWDTSEDTVWQDGVSGTDLPGSGGGSALVRFGHRSSSTSASTWGYVLWTWDAGPTTICRYDPSAFLPPALLTAEPRYVAAGVSVAMSDGPAVTSDSFTIAPAYEHGVERLDPRQHPSPSETWRSLADDAAMDIAWRISGDNEDLNCPMQTDLLGLYVANANVKELVLSRYDVTEVGDEWQELATLNLAQGREGLPYIRQGTTITPDPDGVYDDEPWFAAGELVGGTVDMAGGGGDLRRISWNTEGWWSVREGRRRVIIELEDIDNTEPTTDNCDIWAPRGLLLVHMAGKLQAAFKLAIPPQLTLDGFYEVGTVVLGPVISFARDFAHGDQERRAAIAELTTLANGYRQARSLNSPTRTLSIAISDLYDEAELYSGDGRYLVGTDTTGALVLSNRGDEWTKLDGLMRYVEGPVTPVVYCPLVQVSDGTADEQVVVAERHVLYGRLTSDLSRDLVGGLRETGSVWRGADTLVVEEEV